MPSRNILHVRGRRPKSRIRVRGRVRVADARKGSEKVKDVEKGPIILCPFTSQESRKFHNSVNVNRPIILMKVIK